MKKQIKSTPPPFASHGFMPEAAGKYVSPPDNKNGLHNTKHSATYECIAVYDGKGKLINTISSLTNYVKNEQPNMNRQSILNACNPNVEMSVYGGYQWVRVPLGEKPKAVIEPIVFKSSMFRFYKFDLNGVFIEKINGTRNIMKEIVTIVGGHLSTVSDREKMYKMMLDSDLEMFETLGYKWIVYHNIKE